MKFFIDAVLASALAAAVRSFGVPHFEHSTIRFIAVLRLPSTLLLQPTRRRRVLFHGEQPIQTRSDLQRPWEHARPALITSAL